MSESRTFGARGTERTGFLGRLPRRVTSRRRRLAPTRSRRRHAHARRHTRRSPPRIPRQRATPRTRLRSIPRRAARAVSSNRTLRRSSRAELRRIIPLVSSRSSTLVSVERRCKNARCTSLIVLGPRARCMMTSASGCEASPPRRLSRNKPSACTARCSSAIYGRNASAPGPVDFVPISYYTTAKKFLCASAVVAAVGAGMPAMASAPARASIVLHLQAPADRAFPMLDPVNEKRWAPGLQPTLLGRARVATGLVFTTDDDHGRTAWLLDRYDARVRELRYVVARPTTLTTIDIAVVPDGPQSSIATVTLRPNGARSGRRTRGRRVRSPLSAAGAALGVGDQCCAPKRAGRLTRWAASMRSSSRASRGSEGRR